MNKILALLAACLAAGAAHAGSVFFFSNYAKDQQPRTFYLHSQDDNRWPCVSVKVPPGAWDQELYWPWQYNGKSTDVAQASLGRLTVKGPGDATEKLVADGSVLTYQWRDSNGNWTVFVKENTDVEVNGFYAQYSHSYAGGYPTQRDPNQ